MFHPWIKQKEEYSEDMKILLSWERKDSYDAL